MLTKNNGGLSKGWKSVPLVEVVNPVKGRKPSELHAKRESGDLPYVLISSFGRSDHEYYTSDSRCPTCATEDTLLVWDGARAGLVSTGSSGVIGSTIVALKPKPNLEPKYLYYFMSRLFEEFNNQTRGTGIPHLQREVVYQKEIPLPPIAIQRKIVAKLDAFFKEYNAAKKVQEFATARSEKIMGLAISRLIPNPKESLPIGWRVVQLEELCSKPEYGFTAKSVADLVGPRYIRITDFSDTGILSGTKKVFVKDPPQKFYLKQGDILIARTGATAGHSLLFDSSEKAVFASYLIRFRPKVNLLNLFLNYFLHSRYYWDQVREKEGGSAQPNINATKLASIEIPITDVETQKVIVDKLNAVSDEVRAMTSQSSRISNKLEFMPSLVLKKAFSGELVAE